MTESERKTGLFELFAVFCRVGAVTFGGGLAMLPILERELTVRRSWTSSEQLLDYYAIGQSTPGIIAVNVATFVGYSRRGIPGALTATCGIIFPSLVIIMCLASFLDVFASYAVVQRALRGINVVVAVLLCTATLSMGKKAVRDIPGMCICLAAFVCFAFLKLSGAIVIPLSAAAGIIVQTVRTRRGVRK